MNLLKNILLLSFILSGLLFTSCEQGLLDGDEVYTVPETVTDTVFVSRPVGFDQVKCHLTTRQQHLTGANMGPGSAKFIWTVSRIDHPDLQTPDVRFVIRTQDLIGDGDTNVFLAANACEWDIETPNAGAEKMWFLDGYPRVSGCEMGVVVTGCPHGNTCHDNDSILFQCWVNGEKLYETQVWVTS